jgi:hypothetical protein
LARSPVPTTLAVHDGARYTIWMYIERQQPKVAEIVTQKKPQRRRPLYEFLDQFIESKPSALDPYENYPNGFIFLVLFLLGIFFVNFFVQ